MNLRAIVFVYQQTRRPHKSRCVHISQPSPGPGWRHTATIDPALWLEYLLNNPRERERHIETLCK